MAETNPKLLEAIGFFENVLQNLPGDRTALEFLVVAYEQTGAHTKRRDALIMLVEALLAEKDYDKAQTIAGYLSSFSDHAPAKAVIARVAHEAQEQILKSQFRRDIEGRAVVEAQATVGAADVESDVSVYALSRSASTAEMNLVWLWKERGYLEDDACMHVLHMLTELPITDSPTLISALALLDETYPELTESVLEAMQRACELPAVPLELFMPLPETARAVLPPVFVQIKGVVPFALIENEVLVALLNPLHTELQEEVRQLARRTCHFFIAHPKVILSALVSLAHVDE